METIRLKIRDLLGDIETSGTDTFTYGTSAIFTLTESNVISVIRVRKNDSVSGVVFIYNASTNKVTVTSTLTAGDSIEIDYTYYPNYSTTELNSYVKAALVHIGVHNYQTFEYDATDDKIYPEPEAREENLIAAVSAILINKPIQSLRLPDITINYPENLSLEDKIAKTIAGIKKDIHGIMGIL